MQMQNLSNTPLYERFTGLFKAELPPGYDISQTASQTVLAIFGQYGNDVDAFERSINQISDQAAKLAGLKAADKIFQEQRETLKRPRESHSDTLIQDEDRETKRRRLDHVEMALVTNDFHAMVRMLNENDTDVVLKILGHFIELAQKNRLQDDISFLVITTLVKSTPIFQPTASASLNSAQTAMEEPMLLEVGFDQKIVVESIALLTILIPKQIHHTAMIEMFMDACLIGLDASNQATQQKALHCLLNIYQTDGKFKYVKTPQILNKLVIVLEGECSKDVSKLAASCFIALAPLYAISPQTILNLLAKNEEEVTLFLLQLLQTKSIKITCTKTLFIISNLIKSQNHDIANIAISILCDLSKKEDSISFDLLGGEKEHDTEIANALLEHVILEHPSIDLTKVVKLLVYTMTACGIDFDDLNYYPGPCLYNLDSDLWAVCLKRFNHFHDRAKEEDWNIDDDTYVNLLPLALDLESDDECCQKIQRKIKKRAINSICIQASLLKNAMHAYDDIWMTAYKSVVDKNKALMNIVCEMSLREANKEEFVNAIGFISLIFEEKAKELNDELCLHPDGFKICRTVGSDLIMKFGDKQVNCHKVILASHSDVFETMFSSKTTTKEQNEGVLVIKEENPALMHAVIEFMYGNTCLCASVEEVIGVLKIADKFNIRHLKKQCQHLLMNQLCESNAEAIASYAFSIDYALTQFQADVMLALMKIYRGLSPALQGHIAAEWMAFRAVLLGEVELLNEFPA